MATGDNVSSASSVSKRVNATVVPMKSESDEEYYEIQDKVFNDNKIIATSSKVSYWSWTFGITTFPFFLWGCPFYSLLTEQSSPIRTTKVWLKGLFDYSRHPFATFLACPLLILTVIINGYVVYLFSILFNSLFIKGVYEESMFRDLVDFLRDVPVVIPLNYVWLRGYKVNNIISLLNQKYRTYSQIACGGYRFRLIILMLVTTCIHLIRYFSYEKYSFKDTSFSTILKTIWKLSVNIFVTIMFPVYCTFCYAVRFELTTIKAIVYETISKRVAPNVSHLHKFKILFTHAADHINDINDFFSIYLSLTTVLTIVGTIVDAQNLIDGVAGVAANTFGNLFGASYGSGGGGDAIPFMPNMAPDMINGSQLNNTFPRQMPPPTPFNDFKMGETGKWNQTDPVTVRQINADVACIVLVYALIFFTIWQAVVTNDFVRQVHVWLNDFVCAGSGTDVKRELMDLGVVQDDEHIVNDISSGLDDGDHQQRSDLQSWAHNGKTHDYQTEQLLEKFRMLKSYIHVRMQLEKPSLLTVALVGLFLPSLSGRLRRYRVRF